MDGKQNSLGFTPENVTNKATNLTSPDNTKYPTTQAVSTALSGKQDSLGFTPENVANKQSNLTASATNYPTVDAVNTGLTTKQNKFITATATLTTGGWTLVSGLYEQSISNVNITASSIVDVIPDNSAFATVTAAQLLPRTDSASGSVKVYSSLLPTANIGVTLNIWN